MATESERRAYLHRARQGKSNTELAALTGLDHSHISRIFSGERTPSLQVAIRLSRALKVGLGELVLMFEDEPHSDRRVA